MSVHLVTGGAGFIGSHLVDRLVANGCAVRVLDNFVTGKRENLAGAMAKIELVEGDIRDEATVREAMRDVSVVFHLAALGSVPQSMADPLPTNGVNITGTVTLLAAARDAGAKRFVFSSSSSVYGETEVMPQHEELPCVPISPYGVTKLVGEHYCRVFRHCFGLEAISLRYFNVFGPRQDPKSQYAAAIPLFVSAMLHGDQPKIFDDGEQSRGFTYVSNVVDANIRAAAVPKVSGHAVNISTATSVTVNEVVREIAKLLGQPFDPLYLPPRAGDIKYSLADMSRAKELLDYEAKISFAEGLAMAIGWYREHLS